MNSVEKRAVNIYTDNGYLTATITVHEDGYCSVACLTDRNFTTNEIEYICNKMKELESAIDTPANSEELEREVQSKDS